MLRKSKNRSRGFKSRSKRGVRSTKSGRTGSKYYKRSSSTITRFNSGFGKVLHAKLVYSHLYAGNINTTTSGVAFGNAAIQSYQSSMYDPDFTGLGHQPLYYDTVCGSHPLPYPYYRVYGIGYRFEICATNATSLLPFCLEMSSSSTARTISSSKVCQS